MDQKSKKIITQKQIDAYKLSLKSKANNTPMISDNNYIDIKTQTGNWEVGLVLNITNSSFTILPLTSPTLPIEVSLNSKDVIYQYFRTYTFPNFPSDQPLSPSLLVKDGLFELNSFFSILSNDNFNVNDTFDTPNEIIQLVKGKIYYTITQLISEVNVSEEVTQDIKTEFINSFLEFAENYFDWVNENRLIAAMYAINPLYRLHDKEISLISGIDEMTTLICTLLSNGYTIKFMDKLISFIKDSYNKFLFEILAILKVLCSYEWIRQSTIDESLSILFTFLTKPNSFLLNEIYDSKNIEKIIENFLSYDFYPITQDKRLYLKSKIQFALGYKLISSKSFAEKKFGIQFLIAILHEQSGDEYKENMKNPLIEFMYEKKLLTTYILLPDIHEELLNSAKNLIYYFFYHQRDLNITKPIVNLMLNNYLDNVNTVKIEYLNILSTGAKHMDRKLQDYVIEELFGSLSPEVIDNNIINTVKDIYMSTDNPYALQVLSMITMSGAKEDIINKSLQAFIDVLQSKKNIDKNTIMRYITVCIDSVSNSSVQSLRLLKIVLDLYINDPDIKNLLLEMNNKKDIISSFINNFINYLVYENSGDNLHKTQIYNYAMNVEMRLNVIFLINYMISTTQKTIDILLSVWKIIMENSLSLNLRDIDKNIFGRFIFQHTIDYFKEDEISFYIFDSILDNETLNPPDKIIYNVQNAFINFFYYVNNKRNKGTYIANIFHPYCAMEVDGYKFLWKTLQTNKKEKVKKSVTALLLHLLMSPVNCKDNEKRKKDFEDYENQIIKMLNNKNEIDSAVFFLSRFHYLINEICENVDRSKNKNSKVVEFLYEKKEESKAILISENDDIKTVRSIVSANFKIPKIKVILKINDNIITENDDCVLFLNIINEKEQIVFVDESDTYEFANGNKLLINVDKILDKLFELLNENDEGLFDKENILNLLKTLDPPKFFILFFNEGDFSELFNQFHKSYYTLRYIFDKILTKSSEEEFFSKFANKNIKNIVNLLNDFSTIRKIDENLLILYNSFFEIIKLINFTSEEHKKHCQINIINSSLCIIKSLCDYNDELNLNNQIRKDISLTISKIIEILQSKINYTNIEFTEINGSMLVDIFSWFLSINDSDCKITLLPKLPFKNKYEASFTILKTLLNPFSMKNIEKQFSTGSKAFLFYTKLSSLITDTNLSDDNLEKFDFNLIRIARHIIGYFKNISPSDTNSLVNEGYIFLLSAMSKSNARLRKLLSSSTEFITYLIYNLVFCDVLDKSIISQFSFEVSTKTFRKNVFDLLVILSIDNTSFLSFLTNIIDNLNVKGVEQNTTSTSDVDSRAPGGHIGLLNNGFTCYMNSLLQQIAMNVKLSEDILMSNNPDTSIFPLNESVLYQLKMVIAVLKFSIKKYHNPKHFFNVIIGYDCQQLNPFEQMDVDEFFNLLLDRIEPFFSEGANPFKKHYQGLLQYDFIPEKCGHRSTKVEVFNSLSLQVRDSNSINTSLDVFFDKELLDGENMYYCEQCKKKVPTIKSIAIKQLPRCLVIVLKRFKFDYHQMKKIKINTFCSFEHNINMMKYTTDKDTIPNTEYELGGFIIHSGDGDRGHYYSIIKDDRNKWFEFNDTNVREYDPKNISNDAFGSDNQSKTVSAYLLFYYLKGKDDEMKNINTVNDIEEELRNSINQDNYNFFLHSIVISKQYFDFLSELVINFSSVHRDKYKLPLITKNDNITIYPLNRDINSIKDSEIASFKFVELNNSENRTTENDDFQLIHHSLFKMYAKAYFGFILRTFNEYKNSYIDLMKAMINMNEENAKWLLSSFSSIKIPSLFLVKEPIIGNRAFYRSTLECAMWKLSKNPKEDNLYILKTFISFIIYLIMNKSNLLEDLNVHELYCLLTTFSSLSPQFCLILSNDMKFCDLIPFLLNPEKKNITKNEYNTKENIILVPNNEGEKEFSPLASKFLANKSNNMDGDFQTELVMTALEIYKNDPDNKIFKNCYSLLFETMMWSKMPFIRRKIIEILETGKNDEFLMDSVDLLINNIKLADEQFLDYYLQIFDYYILWLLSKNNETEIEDLLEQYFNIVTENFKYYLVTIINISNVIYLFKKINTEHLVQKYMNFINKINVYLSENKQCPLYFYNNVMAFKNEAKNFQKINISNNDIVKFNTSSSIENNNIKNLVELIQNLNLDAISLDNPYLKMDKKIFSCVGSNFKFSKGDVVSVELMGNSIITRVLDDFIEYSQEDKKINCIRQKLSNIYLIKPNSLKEGN